MPPEFYLDANTVSKAVRRRLTELGYVVHTPAELYGGTEAALGAADEDWLPKVGANGWSVIGCDLKIFERPNELDAYRAAGVDVFLLPGESRIDQRVALIDACLADMCTKHADRKPSVWQMTLRGLEPYEIPKPARAQRRRTR